MTVIQRLTGFWAVGPVIALAMLVVLGAAVASGANRHQNDASMTTNQPASDGGVQQTDTEVGEDDETILDYVQQKWTGDFAGMVKRGFIRILTTHNPLFFTYDGVEQRGLTAESSRAFETYLRKAYRKKARSLHVVMIPVARDELLPGLLEGRGDIAAANLTITPARQRSVAFSKPIYPDVRELVVTGPAAPAIASFDDLATTEIHVRKSSSYFEHLSALNEDRKQAGKPEIPVRAADELLEDHDLLEMVNAALIPAVIVDSHKAALWAQVFEDITVHQELAVHTGGAIAWAIRKESPKLLAVVNAFIPKLRKGSLLGNILIKRYLGSTTWVEDVYSRKSQERYQQTIDFIKQYATEYDFDWLMIVAQAYQESKLDQSKRSAAGAIGIMQLLPSTAADPNVGIPNIRKAEPNVHAGVKYLRFLRERYFSASEIAPLDRVLFAFAAYNAGPRNIAKARKRATKMGFDPQRWFGHVEVAAARVISREPMIYVRNIYKYYVAYKHLVDLRESRKSLRPARD